MQQPFSDKAFSKEEIVDSISINPNEVKCPKCGNNSLVLVGQAQIPQRDIIENGIVTATLAGKYEEGSFSVEEIDCLFCNIKFIVKDHDLFILEKENASLKNKLLIKNNVIDTTVN